MKHLFLLLLLAGCTAPNTSAGTAATDTAAQTDLRPLPEEDYKLFINNGNPYLKEYQEFFAGQLKRYGTNTKGEPLVNFEELKTFASSNSFLGIYNFIRGISQSNLHLTNRFSKQEILDYISHTNNALLEAMRSQWAESDIIALIELGANLKEKGMLDNGVLEYAFEYYTNTSFLSYIMDTLEKNHILDLTQEKTLSTALTWNTITNVKLLISRGMKYDFPPHYGGSFLYQVFLYDKSEKIRYLASLGLDLNYNTDGYTPLIWYTREGDWESAQALVDMGADPNIFPPKYSSFRDVTRDYVIERWDNEVYHALYTEEDFQKTLMFIDKISPPK